jgi:hypothetical protein
MNAYEVYKGSDGEATKALYRELEKLGALGLVAMNLFRAQKCSARAKVYRGGIRGKGSYRNMAYDRKGWSLKQLSQVLKDNELNISYGWGIDESQFHNRHVLYVDLPNGQVSFHSIERYEGGDYVGEWDGVRGVSDARIIRFCQHVLDHNCLPPKIETEKAMMPISLPLGFERATEGEQLNLSAISYFDRKKEKTNA